MLHIFKRGSQLITPLLGCRKKICWILYIHAVYIHHCADAVGGACWLLTCKTHCGAVSVSNDHHTCASFWFFSATFHGSLFHQRYETVKKGNGGVDIRFFERRLMRWWWRHAGLRTALRGCWIILTGCVPRELGRFGRSSSNWPWPKLINQFDIFFINTHMFVADKSLNDKSVWRSEYFESVINWNENILRVWDLDRVGLPHSNSNFGKEMDGKTRQRWLDRILQKKTRIVAI